MPLTRQVCVNTLGNGVQDKAAAVGRAALASVGLQTRTGHTKHPTHPVKAWFILWDGSNTVAN